MAAAAAGDADALAKLDATIERAKAEDGAGAIILGSAGLSGLSGRLSARHNVLTIDCIEAALRAAERAAVQS